MTTHRPLVILATATLMPLMAVACSLPAEDRVSQIDANDLGPELANPTTTTLPVATTEQVTDPSLSEPTTTTTVVAPLTKRQRLYYTIGSSDDLQVVTIELAEEASFASIQNELESPRQEVRELGNSSDVRPGLIDDLVYDVDTVTLAVALDGAVWDAMSESERRNAIGQIVLTFTAFVPVDAGGIGFVTFAIGGSPISVVIPRTQSASEPGQALKFADFESLLGSAVEAPETSAPTTSPSTEPTTASAPATTLPP